MDKKVSLESTVAQLNVVLSGIIKLLTEMALDTFNQVQTQAQQQLGNPTVSSSVTDVKT